METAVLTEEQQQQSLIKRLCIFFTMIYAIQGLSQGGISGLFYLPLSFMLKDKMNFTPEQLAYFRGLVMVPWAVKPLYGLLSDFVPILGYRRRSWLIVAATTATSAALYLAKFCNFSFDQLLFFLIATAFGIAFCDVLCDAVMVENGKKFNMTDKFQAIQWRAISCSSIAAGLVSGLIAKYFTYGQMFLLMAFLPSLVFIAAIFFVPEKRYQYKDSKKTTEVKSISKARDWIIVLIVNLIIVLLLLKLNSRYLEMETLHFLLLFGPALILASLTYVLRRALNKKIIFCILFLFWWDFSLALGGTPFFYYKTEALGFSKVFMGLLGTLGSAGGFFGAWFFMKISRKRIFWGEKPLIELSLEKMLFYSLFVGIATILSSFLVVGAKSAMVLDISFGFIFMFSHLTILVLAAKFCPPQIEGTFFALLMSVINLGASISERVSGMLYKFLHSAASPELANNIPAQVLVWIGWPTQWAVKKPTEGINLFGLYYAAFWLIIMSLGAFCFYFFAIRRFGESIKEEKELEVLNISKLFSENNKNK